VYASEEPATQYVLDTQTKQVLQTGPLVAASLWGSELWQAIPDQPGRLALTHLPSGPQTTTLEMDAPCVPSEIQAVTGRVYWRCPGEGPAGVYDRTTRESTPVPGGDSLLGDGYLVHRPDPSTLEIIDVGYGKGTRRIAAQLASSFIESGRGVTWTVDRFSGDIAYVDSAQRIHLVPAAGATSPLSVIDTVEPLSVDLRQASSPWRGTWRLSKPVASWSLIIRDSRTGAVARTFSGGPARGVVSIAWDGRKAGGSFVTDGTYNWTLVAKPADGRGADVVRSAAVQVSGGTAKWRDFSGDGRGDLLALTSGGTLAVRTGTGTGGLGTGVSATGWPSTSLLAPFGDLSGDKCNDLLVRNSSGALTRYDGSCGKAFSPSGPKLALGSGWNIYNVLTSPGDLTGDGRADLLARTPAGELYLYADSGAGNLKARVKIGTGWQIYNSVTGAGDLNADTFGDLLARDSAGVLWRYNGTGVGTFTARTQIGTGWQIYNSVTGVGDITGDGRADLVARDSAGVLWRYNGTGAGTFTARTQIGTGWQVYDRLL
jgi:hypothetical protein